MVGRLQLCAGLTVGLLAVAACGSESAGGTRPTGRPVARAWLTGVTAMSGDDAWAVGAFRHARDDLPLIEHWDGRTWTVMRADRHLQSDADYLFAGVAATSATDVWAAGTLASQYSFALADHWDGTAWKEVPTPAAGCCFSAAGLSGVDAASPTDAWAVGNKYTSGPRTLILRWNARTRAWVKVPSPNPAGRDGSAAPSSLNGVAVLTGTDAWAVGFAKSGPSRQQNTLIEHWDGSRWTVTSSPNPSRGGCVSDELLGVAATSAATFAVGDYCGAALVLRLNDGQWQQVQVPDPPTGASERLVSVAANDASAWAVGSIGSRMLILHWNGTTWTTQRAPSTPGATSTRLASVTAASPSIAWAVGQAEYPDHVKKLLIERWDGTNLTLVPVPNPPP